MNNNFSTVDGYSYPQKIYNKQARKGLPAKYYMVEGWQKSTWRDGATKHFTIQLTAPDNLNELRVNLRGVLWIRNKHDIREIPSDSYLYDQQGFAVKQFTIEVK